MSADGLREWPVLSGRFVVLQEGTKLVGLRGQSCPGAAVAGAGLLAALWAVQAVGLSSLNWCQESSLMKRDPTVEPA